MASEAASAAICDGGRTVIGAGAATLVLFIGGEREVAAMAAGVLMAKRAKRETWSDGYMEAGR